MKYDPPCVLGRRERGLILEVLYYSIYNISCISTAESVSSQQCVFAMLLRSQSRGTNSQYARSRDM